MNDPRDSAVPTADDAFVVWRAVLHGALVALGVVAAVSVVEAILDHNLTDFQDSGWIYPLFVAILVGYTIGGFQAGRLAAGAELTNGAVAGMGAFVLWVPVRILIWLVRDEHRGLFAGHSPALRPGQLFGQLLLAAAFGSLGGWLAARAARRRLDHGSA